MTLFLLDLSLFSLQGLALHWFDKCKALGCHNKKPYLKKKKKKTLDMYI